jgi:hypothetical protein
MEFLVREDGDTAHNIHTCMWYGDAAIVKGLVEDVEAQSGGSGVSEEKKEKKKKPRVVAAESVRRRRRRRRRSKAMALLSMAAAISASQNNGYQHTRKFFGLCDLASISFLQLEFSMPSILPCLRVWSKPVSSLIHLKMR